MTSNSRKYIPLYCGIHKKVLKKNIWKNLSEIPISYIGPVLGIPLTRITQDEKEKHFRTYQSRSDHFRCPVFQKRLH